MGICAAERSTVQAVGEDLNSGPYREQFCDVWQDEIVLLVFGHAF
jgi:hypothetical protein